MNVFSLKATLGTPRDGPSLPQITHDTNPEGSRKTDYDGLAFRLEGRVSSKKEKSLEKIISEASKAVSEQLGFKGDFHCRLSGDRKH